MPTYEEGDVVKLRWSQESQDEREGQTVKEAQKHGSSSFSADMTFTVEKALPNHVTIFKLKFDRVTTEAPTPVGRERYDSQDPATAKSVFSSPARILLQKDFGIAVASETMQMLRKEDPRIRRWYMDGTEELENTIGDEALLSRFGGMCGWYVKQAAVGESWENTGPVRTAGGYSINMKRTFTLLRNDGVTMDIAVKGVGIDSPAAAKHGLKFEEATLDAKYVLNTASAKLRSAESTLKYKCSYVWRGAPASVTSTEKETIERLD
jgi:hypothetical protein